jgi:hypothetical protein
MVRRDVLNWTWLDYTGRMGPELPSPRTRSEKPWHWFDSLLPNRIKTLQTRQVQHYKLVRLRLSWQTISVRHLVSAGRGTGAHPGTPHPAFTTYNCAIVPRKILHTVHDVIRTTQPTPLSLWAAPRTLHILHGALESAVEAPRGEAIRAQLCTASIASCSMLRK